MFPGRPSPSRGFPPHFAGWESLAGLSSARLDASSAAADVDDPWFNIPPFVRQCIESLQHDSQLFLEKLSQLQRALATIETEFREHLRRADASCPVEEGRRSQRPSAPHHRSRPSSDSFASTQTETSRDTASSPGSRNVDLVGPSVNGLEALVESVVVRMLHRSATILTACTNEAAGGSTVVLPQPLPASVRSASASRVLSARAAEALVRIVRLASPAAIVVGSDSGTPPAQRPARQPSTSAGPVGSSLPGEGQLAAAPRLDATDDASRRRRPAAPSREHVSPRASTMDIASLLKSDLVRSPTPVHNLVEAPTQNARCVALDADKAPAIAALANRVALVEEGLGLAAQNSQRHAMTVSGRFDALEATVLKKAVNSNNLSAAAPAPPPQTIVDHHRVTQLEARCTLLEHKVDVEYPSRCRHRDAEIDRRLGQLLSLAHPREGDRGAAYHQPGDPAPRNGGRPAETDASARTHPMPTSDRPSGDPKQRPRAAVAQPAPRPSNVARELSAQGEAGEDHPCPRCDRHHSRHANRQMPCGTACAAPQDAASTAPQIPAVKDHVWLPPRRPRGSSGQAADPMATAAPSGEKEIIEDVRMLQTAMSHLAGIVDACMMRSSAASSSSTGADGMRPPPPRRPMVGTNPPEADVSRPAGGEEASRRMMPRVYTDGIASSNDYSDDARPRVDESAECEVSVTVDADDRPTTSRAADAEEERNSIADGTTMELPWDSALTPLSQRRDGAPNGRDDQDDQDIVVVRLVDAAMSAPTERLVPRKAACSSRASPPVRARVVDLRFGH